jgi:uncharacterized membrane protein YdjX (TVP38/TMEM64 family)
MAAVSENNRFSLRRLMPLGLIAVVAVAGYVFLGDFLSFETLRDNRDGLIGFRDQHYFSLVMLFLAAYVVIVGFSLPGGAVASITGGFLFGVFPGVAFNVVGATLGALVIFSAARYGLGEALSRRMEASEGAVRQIRDGLKENEISFLFLMRLVPAVPFFAANLVPALVGVSTFRFAMTTFIGIIPGALVFTWIGAGLGGVFERGETPDLGIIFEPQILGPILGLCALAALPVLIKAIRKGKS